MSTGPGLESLVDQQISVITNDGRNIVGILKGYDQATNIILDESHERVYSTKQGVQQLVLGLYIIRGDNISVVGELDEELEASLDLSKLRAQPLKPLGPSSFWNPCAYLSNLMNEFFRSAFHGYLLHSRDMNTLSLLSMSVYTDGLHSVSCRQYLKRYGLEMGSTVQ
ncbi:hypothetical protein H6P81_016587 [Aristolochia fimbriata]|uniref:U6 snRNA-associated Sm-like protein LSm8 n=2 Tax=Magnoliopsida TaxID=3398 RepID=A0AAV7EBY2_ARIFI|nr:hypothetical protein H6P81_016587 [Aristolochia fimbriata]